MGEIIIIIIKKIMDKNFKLWLLEIYHKKYRRHDTRFTAEIIEKIMVKLQAMADRNLP